MNRRGLIAIARNAHTDRAGSSTPIWETQAKRTARAAERAGLVTIVVTPVKFAGLTEWRVTLTPAGLALG